MARDPHREQPVIVWGAPLVSAPAALILVHGRGGSPGDMQALARELDRPQLACLAPAAAGGTWYPFSFLERIERNEPHLSSALRLLTAALGKVEAAGLTAPRVALLGFSQGACLTLEFAARNARRFGAVIGFSGGLIGPEGTPRDYTGSVEGTPVFLGSSDVDPHVPKRRVDETDAVFTRLGAQVTKRIYPGMGHTVSADEIAHARVMLDAVLASAAAR